MSRRTFIILIYSLRMCSCICIGYYTGITLIRFFNLNFHSFEATNWQLRLHSTHFGVFVKTLHLNYIKPRLWFVLICSRFITTPEVNLSAFCFRCTDVACFCRIRNKTSQHTNRTHKKWHRPLAWPNQSRILSFSKFEKKWIFFQSSIRLFRWHISHHSFSFCTLHQILQDNRLWMSLSR